MTFCDELELAGRSRNILLRSTLARSTEIKSNRNTHRYRTSHLLHPTLVMNK